MLGSRYFFVVILPSRAIITIDHAKSQIAGCGFASSLVISNSLYRNYAEDQSLLSRNSKTWCLPEQARSCELMLGQKAGELPHELEAATLPLS